MNTQFPLEALRELFLNALPEEQAQADEQAPELSRFYVPSTHIRALNPNNMLVEGIRGSGKSFWWAALQDEHHRELVADLLPSSELANTHCCAGFGQTPSDNYPSKRILKPLIKKYDAQDIWQTIIAWNVLKLDMPKNNWEARIEWVKSDPERIERAFIAKDKELQKLGLKKLILFDALDRAADDWESLRRLLKGLLQVLLEFRSYRAIRLKAFVRPDMLEDAEVSAFPDGSKVISSKVMLDWPKIELFNLLWHHLGNEPKQGELFRKFCNEKFLEQWEEHSSVWIIPDKMRVNEAVQREIFHALAGPYMGNNARRGFPYTWLPNHLGDGYDKTSPRSFLAALHTAALEHLRDKQAYPLHYQSIKKGVQTASSIRVGELREDYPWIDKLMILLKGQTVPCEFDAITKRWEQKKVLKSLQQANDEAVVRLPPSRLEQGYEGIKQDLVRVGIFRVMRDGRINMPDVYRIGYGLGRKGGVKPVR